MSETPPEKPAQEPETPAKPEPPKPETDWKAEARKWEQRAKENTSAAEKLAALEEANKTELQKAQERIKELETATTEAQRTALRTRVAAEMNVPVEVLQGDDEETVKASAQRILEWRDSNKVKPPEPKRLKSGSSDSGAPSGSRAAAALRQMRAGN